MNENNLETVTSLSSDLSTRENITIKLEELLIAGNYDEAKLLLEPSQPVDIADAIGSLPLILQALAFRLLKKKINFIQSPWLNILYKKYKNPLKDVKQEKKPLNKISLLESLNLFLIKKPTKNDPIIEIKKLLLIVNLKNVAR